jgi:N-acetylglucosamine kinase-like BadF-type ATPase
MFVLGIDAGGSKTLAYLAADDGSVVAQGRGGPANLQASGELDVEKVLHDVVEQVIGDRPVTIGAVCLGMAGMDRPGDEAVARAMMRRLGFRRRTLVVNDALIALTAGAGDGPGLVLVSGTGSIAYGRNAQGLAARAGGWGFAIGDEGSGYWIGRRALAAVMRAADGREPATQLTGLVLAHFGLEREDGLVAEIYERGLRRDVIAALGGVVARAHAEGDAVAGEILALAAGELALAAGSVASRLGLRGEAFPTVLAGGLFKAVPWLEVAVRDRMAEVAPRSVVAPLTVEPAMGAVRLALAELQGGAPIPVYIGAKEQA